MRVIVIYIPTYLRDSVAYVPTCQPACQFFNLAWQFFRHSFYEILREISILYGYIKNSTLYLYTYNSTFYIFTDIISHRKIVLYFISILHFISKKSL